MNEATLDHTADAGVTAPSKRPWVTPAIIRASSSQTEKSGVNYDAHSTSPGPS